MILECGQRRLPTRRLRQARSRREEKRRRRNLAGVEVVRHQLPVRYRRIAVERDRKAVWRPHLAERRRGVQAVVDGEEAHVDSLTREEVADEVPVRVAADPRDDRWRQTEPGEAR